MLQSITILGATGSIGQQALEVIALHPERYSVFALTAHSQWQKLFKQCEQYQPKYAVLIDELAAQSLRAELQSIQSKTEVLVGTQALIDVVVDSAVDTVLAAIVGAAGLLSTLAAVKQGKKVLLANKESLVMAGELFVKAVQQSKAIVLPVDSEHNAIFQCMPQGYIPMQTKPEGIDGLILTASGGPFRSMPLEQFATITPAQAVAHPNWVMGAKISVDSATMMNKGLEVVEAHYLFSMPVSKIEVIIHPQSMIHSMVRYIDGSVLAELGEPDMRTPIAHTLAWPSRIAAGVKKLDFQKISQLEFFPMDLRRYPCLSLAYQALQQGGSAITMLNAANEVAVAKFLAGKISFLQIAETVDYVLQKLPNTRVESIEDILNIDKQARDIAENKVYG